MQLAVSSRIPSSAPPLLEVRLLLLYFMLLLILFTPVALVLLRVPWLGLLPPSSSSPPSPFPFSSSLLGPWLWSSSEEHLGMARPHLYIRRPALSATAPFVLTRTYRNVLSYLQLHSLLLHRCACSCILICLLSLHVRLLLVGLGRAP